MERKEGGSHGESKEERSDDYKKRRIKEIKREGENGKRKRGGAGGECEKEKEEEREERRR